MPEPTIASALSSGDTSREPRTRRIRDTLSRAYSRAITRLATPVTRDTVKRVRIDLQRSDAATTESYHQLEALIGLYATLGIQAPLPRMRGYAVSPDFACELARIVRALEPDLVVEFGSGVSTVISAYALSRNGHGRIVSLDHDADWCANSRALIAEHGLESIAEVVHAPLTPLDLHGEQWLWYDMRAITPLDSIDLLVVDGPPGHIQSLARYPSVPVMLERLRPEGAILLDDTDRDDEQEMLGRWSREFESLSFENRRTEKGTVIARRNLAP